MADGVGRAVETSSSVYNAKSAFMDMPATMQGHTQQHPQSGAGTGGSPDAAQGGGFGSPTSSTPSSSYHHQVVSRTRT